jgi:hypothetical protein
LAGYSRTEICCGAGDAGTTIGGEAAAATGNAGVPSGFSGITTQPASAVLAQPAAAIVLRMMPVIVDSPGLRASARETNRRRFVDPTSRWVAWSPPSKRKVLNPATCLLK